MMNTIILKRIFTVILLVLWTFPLTARLDAQGTDEVRRALDQARRLERMQRYEDALEIHQRLLSAHPDNPDVVSGIERDLLQLKRYSELIDVLQEIMRTHPEDLSLWEKLGNAFYKSGQEEKAEETWRLIIERSPDDQASYDGVARQYLYNGIIDKAIDMYLLGREKLGKPSLFAGDLARLYESQMEYGDATREYVCLLEEDPKQYSYVENMISRFKRTENVDEAVVKVLENVVEENPGDSNFRKLLGSQYLRMAQPEKAFEQYVAIEEIEQSRGGTLIDFADWSLREGFYLTALKAYQHIMDLYPESPLIPNVLQGMGRSLTKLDRFHEAISAYRSLASQYPKSSERESALFEIGRIQLLETGDVDSALSAFSELVKARKQGPYYFDAMFLIGECHLVKGDLTQALNEYERAHNEARNSPEIAEEAAYKTAEIRYFRGDFEGAIQELEGLTKNYPQGLYVNDALALIVFIEENRFTGDDALRAFANATLLERQKGIGEAVQAYQRILDYYPHSLLTDDALLKIGHIRNGQGDFEVAIQTYERLIASYPSSELCDEAQRRIGEIYEVELGDVPKAIEAYEEILSKYPESLLYDYVRKKIRELQNKIGSPG